MSILNDPECGCHSKVIELQGSRIFQGKDATINGHNAIELVGDGRKIDVVPDAEVSSKMRIVLKENAYERLEKKRDHLYEIHYRKLDYDYAFGQSNVDAPAVGGACSVLSVGNLVGRNYDWLDDYTAAFAVHTPKSEGRNEVWGMATHSGLTIQKVDSGEYSDAYNILPFYLRDGVNEHGLFAEMNVVPRTGNDIVHPIEETEIRISARMLVRFILDCFSNVDDAVHYLQHHAEIFNPQELIDKGYELHYFLKDASGRSTVLEFIDGSLEEAVDSGETYHEILTNFHVFGVETNEDGSVNTPYTAVEGLLPSANGIEPNGAGLERWNILNRARRNGVNTAAEMKSVMWNVRYSTLYRDTQTDVAWCSELVGGDVTVDTPADDARFIERLEAATYAWNHRSKDNPEVWITTHSCVYDLERREFYVRVQENQAESRFGFAQPVMFFNGQGPDEDGNVVVEIPEEIFERGNGFASVIKKSLDPGHTSTANGLDAVSIGTDTKASGDYSYAEGQFSLASGEISHAEGYNGKARSKFSHIEGYENIAGNESGWTGNVPLISSGDTGVSSHAEGAGVLADGNISHAEGGRTRSKGDYSHAEGMATLSSGKYSHAEGSESKASGQTSHAEGYSTLASGKYSHTEGEGTIASGLAAHAEGCETTASGTYSHAEGVVTVAEGLASHAEGSTTKALAETAHAEGGYTEATMYGSHAEGEETQALAYDSHAEGWRSVVHEDAAGGHAEGNATEVYCGGEHAEGEANLSYNGSTPGTRSIHTVGIGTFDEDDEVETRRNAEAIMQNGDKYVLGIGGYDGTTINNVQTVQQVISNLANFNLICDLSDITPPAVGSAIQLTPEQFARYRGQLLIVDPHTTLRYNPSVPNDAVIPSGINQEEALFFESTDGNHGYWTVLDSGGKYGIIKSVE